MNVDPKSIVNGVTSVVQSAQAGVEVGNSSNAFEGYLNTLNLAGTIAGTSPIGVGLNASAAMLNTVSMTDKWMKGQLTPADVMQVTSAVLGTMLAIAAVSGAPITVSALAIAAAVAIVGGPGARDWFNDKATGLADAITGMPLPGIISPILGTTPDPLVKTIKWVPYVDPLILDLDGDGLEITPLSKGILFDTNGDSIKTGTAWAGADDALLVRDLNGNGQIDSGAELFGDNTVLANGSKASNGYTALADLDSNANGKMDAGDAAFNDLRIWRDLNQDGISQATELRNLSQICITSIGVNGNQIAQSTTFTQNGTTRTVGAVDLQVNNFCTQFPAQLVDEAGSPVAITAQAKALPHMNGSGMERNMQAAA